MRTPIFRPAVALLGWLLLTMTSTWAQQVPRFAEVVRQTNGDVALKMVVTAAHNFRLDAASELPNWQPVVTIKSPGNGTNLFTDTTAAYLGSRFYRVVELDETNALTGDHFLTTEGEIVVHPVNHASFVMRWGNKMIYNDPVGGSGLYSSFPKADLILVSHSHGDHFDSSTLNGIKTTNTIIIGPAAVYSSLGTALKAQTIALANGGSTNVLGLTVDAIPAYNSNHPKGTGNGYVVTLGGKRFFMTGDTGNIAEMRALQNIDVAFMCMNVPYTMTIAEAVTAARAFQPRVVYPYHYRNQDNSLANLTTFKNQVGTDLGIEVRARKWY